MRSDWSLESIKTKVKQLRRGAPDQSRLLKRHQTTDVLAEIRTAVTETPRQTLSVLRRYGSLDMSRSTLWRAPHEDLQARCFKPVRAPRLTAENRLARLNFCRDVLQRANVLSVRGKRHLEPLDLTRVVITDEKFFRWNYTGPAENSPIWVVGAHGDTCTKGGSRSRYVHQRAQPAQPRHHGGRSDGERHRFPAVLHRRGVRVNTECYIRMLDDVYLPHCMARLGTDTSSWWWQEDNAPSHTSRRTKAFLKEREIQLLSWLPCSPDLNALDFHFWQEWETALGERQFQSRLEVRAMIVRTMPEATISSTACGGPAHTHAFFLVSFDLS